MQEDTVVGLPRPSGTVEDDLLLCVLRDGARQMLMHAIEAEVAAFLAATPIRSTGAGVAAWSAMAMRPSGSSKPASAESRCKGLGFATVAPTPPPASASPRRCCQPTCAGPGTSRSFALALSQRRL
jgi:hypothetical protein